MAGFTEKVEELGRRNRVIPAYIRALVVAPFVALDVYMIVEKKWIYLWLRDLQIDSFDGYYMLLTIMLTTIISVAPALPVISIIRKRYEAKSNKEEL